MGWILNVLPGATWTAARRVMVGQLASLRVPTRGRKRTDRLYMRSLGPREREALALIEQQPGITVVALADELGVTMKRMWAMLGRLERTACGGRGARRADDLRP